MSAVPRQKPVTAPDIAKRKGNEPVVCLTAYHANTARLIDPHVDLILVGDSLGMVVHGLPSTIGVTLDMMIMHGQSVMRGAKRAMVVIDMPFGSYEESPEQAFRAARRIIMETGAAAVKLEGGVRMAETVRFLVERGIPVMGHIGLTPQAVNTMGGFRTQGLTRADWPLIEADARAISDAGAFSMVLEGMAEPLAAKITSDISAVTVGIGASAACDGQILVLEDMLGFNPRVPRFVKRYAELGDAIGEAVQGYADDVRARSFPGEAHIYQAKD